MGTDDAKFEITFNPLVEREEESVTRLDENQITHLFSPLRAADKESN